MSKHTPGPAHLRNGYASDIDNSGGGYLASAGKPEDAARLVLCWNMHDEMVAALESCAAMMDDFGADYPATHNQVRALLAKLPQES